jgi:predicted Zn-dependent protease
MSNSARTDYERAVDWIAKGEKEKAASALEQLVKDHPDFADAYETLGMVFYKMNRLDDAIAWTDKLVKLRPDYAMAHTNLSVFYMKKGDKIKAEEEKAQATVLSFSKPKK